MRSYTIRFVPAAMAAIFLCACSSTHHGPLSKPPAVKPLQPVFSDASIVQSSDLRGRLNVVAVAGDGSLWRFREPGSDRRWLAESLGGQAAGVPSMSFTAEGLLRVWSLGRDHSVLSNAETEDGGPWTGWVRVDPGPAVDIVTAPSSQGTIVLVRGADGTLDLFQQRGASTALTGKQHIPATAATRPLLFVDGPAAGGSTVEVVFVANDGTLTRAVQRPGSAELQVAAIAAPKVRGELAAVALRDRVVVIAREESGALYAVERREAGWSKARPLPRVAGTAPMSMDEPRMFTIDAAHAFVIAHGPRSTLWVVRETKGRWGAWTDTKVPVDKGATLAMTVGGRLAQTNAGSLESIARTHVQDQLLGFFISTDQISPDPLFEGDHVTVHYSLSNYSSSPGTGSVSASWDKRALKAVSPEFAPPLAPGSQFQGSFTMGGFFEHADKGAHQLHLQYKASTVNFVLDDPALGIGPIVFENITQYAEDNTTVQVMAYTDPFPTDDPLVQAGPYWCVGTTADQQHTCGLGSCQGGNTPQTCPEDCPPTQPDVRAYNSQDLCRKFTDFSKPRSIADVQGAIQAAANARTRIRAVGNLHTSNAQICTEGQEMSMSSLIKAVPRLTVRPEAHEINFHGDYCSRFNCEAPLDTSGPVIEMFEGVQTVRVGPGMRLYDLERFLDEQRLSLGFGVAQFRDPTVGGAIATGTHGSSPIHPSLLSTRVRSLTIVKANGDIAELSEQATPTNLWKAARTNLGFLGVVVQVRLAVEPSFNLHGTADWKTASDLLAKGAPISLIGQCDFGELIWFPNRGADDASVMRICETKTDATGSGELRLQKPEDSEDPARAYPALDLMQRDACSQTASCGMEKTRMQALRYYQPAFVSSNCDSGKLKVGLDSPPELLSAADKAGLVAFGAVTLGLGPIFAECCTRDCNVDTTGKWYDMITSDTTRADFRPFERDWEIFIPGDKAQDAIRLAKDYFAQHGICLPLVGVLLRFAPPEDGTLIAHTVKEGPFQESSVGMFFEMAIFIPKGITCSNKARYEKVYSDLAELLVSPPIDGRGHWAKNRRSLFQLQRRLGKYGDNMMQFRKVVAEMDPKGMFANQFGVDIGLRWPQMTTPVPVDTDTPSCTPDPPPPPAPTCGTFEKPCCTHTPACLGSLQCKNGKCKTGPINQCGQCTSKYEQCLSNCGDASFCDCTCRNRECSCQEAFCNSHCILRRCE